MTPLKYILASLRHYRRANLAVALGVAVAAAVLSGALIVGDSVRGSLRDLTLQRLGYIDRVLVGRQPFRAELAEELRSAPGFEEHFAGAAPAFLLRASVSHQGEAGQRLAGGVNVIGAGPEFWRADAGRPGEVITGEVPKGEVWITQPLADELEVAQGKEVLLRLPSLEAIPADSPLGEKTDTTVGARLTVGRILPAEGLARFSLSPSQRPPRTAFVSIGEVQELVDQPGRVNALLLLSSQVAAPTGDAATDWLKEHFAPKLADYGVTLEQLSVAGRELLQIESNQLVISDELVEAARTAFAESARQPVVSYLANTIKAGDKSIPYSTVAGVDSTAQLGPLLDDQGQPIELAQDEVALNSWAADRLGVAPGDSVTFTYYQPESTHGELTDGPPLVLRVKAVAPLAGADGAPTAAADPRLAPQLPGVTDQESIRDWDLPFELVETITPEDEQYWDDYRTTPKAFVSFALAERLWSTRWGSVSLVRLPAEAAPTPEAAADRLLGAIDPEDLGLAFQAVKAQGLAASSGSTPFDVLFLMFSMFVIASAVMLISLLFRLGVEQRSKEIGLLQAVGVGEKQYRRLLMREALVVAAIGALVGLAGGVAYAAVMLLGLRTLWVEAIVSPFLQLHVSPLTLAIGLILSLAVAWVTLRFSVRRVTRRPARELLAGQVGGVSTPRTRKWHKYAAIAALLLAAAAAAWGATQQAEAQAGAFFATGALLLAGLVTLARVTFLGGRPERGAPSTFGLWTLALKNVARHPGRTTLTVALVAAASFLILAVSAFRLPPTEEGTGGFAVVGVSSQPLHYSLNTDDGRFELGIFQEDAELLERHRAFAFRVHDGEDASCLNLYQTQQPRVLGLPDDFLQRGGFEFAAAAEAPESTAPSVPQTGWRALKSETPEAEGGERPVPVVLDLNTAMYSLKLYGGVGAQFTIRDAADRAVTLEVVGLLKNSMLQGDVLMSEQNFLRLFPENSGSRFFLFEPDPGANDADKLAAMLEDRLSDSGFDAETAARRLSGFLAVQNTYLSTFQALGGLGLLLGTVGLAVVQLRNVNERRGELALLRAAGFTRGRLGRLILRENALLLVAGLAAGGLAAVVALAPQALQRTLSFPWASAAVLLGSVAVVGLLAGGLATRSAARGAIVPALRGE